MAFTPVNVAASSNGGVATASSSHGEACFDPSNVINGSRDPGYGGTSWGNIGNLGGWNDGTQNTFPDTFDVTFNAVYTIGEIDIITLKDSFSTSAVPGPSDTFSLYGITNFDVQYWNGTTYQTLQSITGNNLVWRKVTFAPVATSKIRLSINDSAEHTWSRLVELEAWTVEVASSPTIKTWTGTQWTPKPFKVWSGTAWAAKPIKYWTGSAWVQKP